MTLLAAFLKFSHWHSFPQAEELVRGACEESELISALKNAGLATDQERLDEYADRFLRNILQVDQETEKWEERITQDEDNDIVKRAKNMSSMAFSMYQFTRGEGALKTTQDLFTQGEYFASRSLGRED